MSVAAPFTHQVFRDFFPLPRFLEMPAFGLDISDRAVTALELIPRRDAFVVGRFSRRPLSAGAIADGYVHDKESVIAVLRALAKELRLSFVNASLPEEKAYLYRTKLPLVSQKEMRGAILFTLEDNVPLSPEEAVFDYTVIRRAPPSPGDSVDVSVTVLPRAVVETYGELFSAAGLIPLSFELGAQAICRAVISRGDRDTYLVLHFGEEKTGLFIVQDETVQFTATAAVGAAAITEEMSRDSASPPRTPGGEGVKNDSARHINGAPSFSSADAVGVLRAEVGKVISYWQTHAGGSGEAGVLIEKVVLCGKGAAHEELRETLSRLLALPVLAAQVWRNVCSFDAYIPPILFDESLEYAAAVGLALPKGT